MGKLFTPQDLNSGFNSNASLNANFDAIETAFDKCLSRTGETPNFMDAPLDMNGQSIINVGSLLASDLEIEGISITDQVAAAEQAATDAQAAQSAAETAQANAETAETNAESWASQAQAAYNNILFLDIEIETGSFSLDDSYSNKVVFVDSSTSVTCTIGGCSIGFQVLVIQAGSGAVTFSSSDTILTRDGLVTTGEGAVASVIQYEASTVYLNGQLG